MKKQLTVINNSTVAFDDHRVTLKGPDATVVLHLHDASEFDSLKEGDEITISFEGATPKKKAKAKKAA